MRKLPIALYRKARDDRQWRFWSLDGESHQRGLLEQAFLLVARNGGAHGVDGQPIGSITATPVTRQSWLEQWQRELQSKNC